MSTIVYHSESGRIKFVSESRVRLSRFDVDGGYKTVEYSGDVSDFWKSVSVEDNKIIGVNGQYFDVEKSKATSFYKREELNEYIQYKYEDPNPGQLTISIIRMIGIGDVLMSQQVALPSIRKTFPDAHITFWTSPVGARVLYNNPNIDRIKVSNWKHGTSPVVEPKVEMTDSDIVVNLVNKVDFLPIVTKANRPDNLFNVARDQIYIQSGKKLKKEKNNHKIYTSPESIEWYYNVCLDNSIDSEVIGCAMNSHGDMRYYPLKNWIKLAEICKNKKFIWFADRSEFINVVNLPENVINTCGSLNFSEFLSMWMNCDICIGPDSGGMNISGVNNQKFIALIGSTKAKDHIINYNSVSCVSTKPKLKCMPCYDWQIRNDCQGQGLPWCMERITPYQIQKQIYKMS